ncbi:hypothetical protein BSL84_30805 [Streptomyces sp. TN58]|nr:hypothetical protein BSL84_30805 [Streptomyces sp. TN58]
MSLPPPAAPTGVRHRSARRRAIRSGEQPHPPRNGGEAAPCPGERPGGPWHGGRRAAAPRAAPAAPEAAAGVTAFILAGRYFEARSKRKAGAALQALLELGGVAVGVGAQCVGEER